MANPTWFELDPAQVRVDSGLKPKQLVATWGDSEMETAITRHIAAQVKIVLGECREAAADLSFPNSDDELKKIFTVPVVWPVIVAQDSTAAERSEAESEARQDSIDAEIVVPYPITVKFEAQTGNPDDNVAITQADIDAAVTAAAAERESCVEEQKETFTLAIGELVIAKLWYSMVVEPNVENTTAKNHYISGRQLVSSLTKQLKQNAAQHRINRGGGFF